MPAWLAGKDGEKGWEKAKKAAREQYPGLEKGDSDKFYAIVTTIYKRVCSNKDWDCGIKKSESVGVSMRMRQLVERLASFGNPNLRKMAVYDLASVARNFAGDMAYKLANKSDPYGEMAANYPEVKRTGKKMVAAIQAFVDAVVETEQYLDIAGDAKTLAKR